jgi:hypothetical protein
VAVAQGDAAERSEFGVMRYTRDFSGQNRLGGLVTARSDRGGETNVVGGVDGFWRPTSGSYVRGTLTRSTTSGAGGEGLGGYVWAANEANWGYVGYISELVTAGYDARTGFVLRHNYVRISPAVTLDWRPSWRPSRVRRFQPGFTFEHFVDPTTGAAQEGFISIRPFTVQFHNGGILQYVAQPNWQRLRSDFKPVTGVTIAPGDYDYLRQSLVVQTDPSARYTARFEATLGGYFDGALQTWHVIAQATPEPRLAVNLDYTLNRLRRVGPTAATLATHLLSLETRLAASPRLQGVSVLQWNTAARQLSVNARLAWEYRPLAFFTVVYNDRSVVDGAVQAPAPAASRQFLVKLTWLAQL